MDENTKEKEADKNFTEDQKILDASTQAKLDKWRLEDEATERGIEKNFESKSKDMAERYAQAYNGGTLHSDFDENDSVHQVIQKAKEEKDDEKELEKAKKDEGESKFEKEKALKKK